MTQSNIFCAFRAIKTNKNECDYSVSTPYIKTRHPVSGMSYFTFTNVILDEFTYFSLT